MIDRKNRLPLNNIERIRREQKLSMEALGARIGVDASTINKMEKGKISISHQRLVELAAALGVTPNDLLAEAHSPSVGTATPAPARQEIPVMGAAAGSLLQGTLQMTEGPVDWISTPKALENARGLYGLYIDGNSMEPMFRHGSLCLVSEYKPPRIGDVVIVQEKKNEAGPIQASIGILEARNSTKIQLRKLNPNSVIDIDSKWITSIHKVLDYGEILGIS